MAATRECEYCGYEFDARCGAHGCPNCLAEPEQPPKPLNGKALPYGHETDIAEVPHD